MVDPVADDHPGDDWERWLIVGWEAEWLDAVASAAAAAERAKELRALDEYNVSEDTPLSEKADVHRRLGPVRLLQSFSTKVHQRTENKLFTCIFVKIGFPFLLKFGLCASP